MPAAFRISCSWATWTPCRDWGYAKDYVECMWLILQQDEPEDFVIATGEQHTVREFTELAFAHAGIELRWEGQGMEEKGYDKATGKMLVCVNPRVVPTHRRGQSLGRSHQGENETRLESPEDQLRGTGKNHGTARSSAGKEGSGTAGIKAENETRGIPGG